MVENQNTVESHNVKLGLREILVKSKFVWSPVLNLIVLFYLIYCYYLKFRCVRILGFSAFQWLIYISIKIMFMSKL